jgi:hypothetical protein
MRVDLTPVEGATDLGDFVAAAAGLPGHASLRSGERQAKVAGWPLGRAGGARRRRLLLPRGSRSVRGARASRRRDHFFKLQRQHQTADDDEQRNCRDPDGGGLAASGDLTLFGVFEVRFCHGSATCNPRSTLNEPTLDHWPTAKVAAARPAPLPGPTPYGRHQLRARCGRAPLSAAAPASMLRLW